MTNLIIDFDSTFVKVEALDKLAEIVLKNNSDKKEILAKIKKTTELGMEGKIPFDTSLEQRFKLFSPEKKHIKKLIKVLQENITPSIKRNKSFFEKHSNNVFIISGGFKDYINPITKSFSIPEENVFANTFIYNKKDQVIGFDRKNPLSKKAGKTKLVKKHFANKKLYVIGDGYTDYEIKEKKLAQRFFALIENVKRDAIVKKPDVTVVKDFDEILYDLRLPRALSYPKSKMKVLLLENISTKAADVFKSQGYEVETEKAALDEEQLISRVKNISILGIRSKTKITKKVLKKANKLLTIGAFCIGTNQFDLQAATENGVAIFNAPYSNTRSVVELVIGEIIMLARGISDKNTNLHKGVWQKSAEGSNEIRGKTLGIIGYGNIGSQLSVVAEALGMKVTFFDTQEKLALGNAKKSETLQELLKSSDIVTVHVDGREQNANLISEKEFSQMKTGSIFLNLSRGHIVDLDALAKHIKNKKIRGASIDVYPKEPHANTKDFKTPLQNLPNTILTPHIGGSTQEAQKNIGDFVSARIIDFVDTGNTTLSVNLPNITLQQHKDSHRLIHIHKNTPGVIAKINKVCAQNKANIIAQYLKTNESTGYVITDINKKYSNKMIQEMKKIPGTIKFRILY